MLGPTISPAGLEKCASIVNIKFPERAAVVIYITSATGSPQPIDGLPHRIAV